MMIDDDEVLTVGIGNILKIKYCQYHLQCLS